jgi:ribosomal protein L40E
MKGPLQLIRRRRAEPAADPASEPEHQREHEAAASGDSAPAPTAESTTSSLHALDARAAPAGADPADARRPTFRTRARARRRLRYLRRVRELGFRDLGGLLFDQHRFARPNEELVRGKLDAIAAVDHELRALERVLDDRRPITELREPGVSVCPRCGALHASEARFCSSCGLQLRGPRPVAEIGEAAGGLASATPPATSAPAPAPTSLPAPQPESLVEPPSAESGAPAEPVEPPSAEPGPPAEPSEQPTTVMPAAGGEPAGHDRPEP